MSKTRRTFRSRTLALFTCVLALCAATTIGCSSPSVSAEDLSSNVQPAEQPENEEPMNDNGTSAITNFGVNLLRTVDEGTSNVLVSPLSVQLALGMTANGASGETLTQMEQALGMPLSELNTQLGAAMRESDESAESGNAAESGSKDPIDPTTSAADAKSGANPLHLANSLWIRDTFTIQDQFLQTNATWYHAGVFRAPFDDSTKDDINSWTKEHTDGMIPAVLDKAPINSVMFLVNALAFQDKWADVYDAEDVIDGTFTTQDGTSEQARFMTSFEATYLEGTGVTGFIKPYQTDRYAFAALLPNEGTTVEEVLAGLDGETLHAVLSSPHNRTVDAWIPKFTDDYGTSLNDALKAMGVTDAFDPMRADFSNMTGDTVASEPLFIGSVTHKTHIEVDEQGTKAAAATSIGMATTSMPQPAKTVHLDRPFIYAVIDQTNGMPLFIGVVRSVS